MPPLPRGLGQLSSELAAPRLSHNHIDLFSFLLSGATVKVAGEGRGGLGLGGAESAEAKVWRRPGSSRAPASELRVAVSCERRSGHLCGSDLPPGIWPADAGLGLCLKSGGHAGEARASSRCDPRPEPPGPAAATCSPPPRAGSSAAQCGETGPSEPP